MNESVCPKCQQPTSDKFNFCPNCGRRLREPPQQTTLGAQAKVYALSIFLPPLGLWPAVKYLKQPDSTRKTIGIVCIVLTVVSLIITYQYTVEFTKQFNSTLNQQLQQYQNFSK